MSSIITFLNHPAPYLVTAIFAALMIWYVRRQPRRPGMLQFNWLMIVWLAWAVFAALTTITRSTQLLYVFFVLQIICSLTAVALELMVVLEYTGREKWLTWHTLLPLFFPLLIFMVMAFAFPEFIISMEYHSGVPVFVGRDLKWGFYIYAIIMVLITFSVLTTSLFRAPAFRWPILLIMLGPIAPMIGLLMIDPQQITVSPIQVVILLTNFTMLFYSVAMYNFRILQVVPVARDTIISHMPYSLIVLDAENHLVDFNSAAQSLPDLPGKLALRQAASKVLGGWWERISPLIGTELTSCDVFVQSGVEMWTIHVISLPLLQPSGWRMGQVFLFEDVTQIRHTQQQQVYAQQSLATLQERERLARELHDSLGQTLAAARLQVSTARLLLAQGETSQTDKCLEQMVDMTLTAETDVREYLLGTKTSISADHLLFPTLRQYVVRFSQQYGLPVELSVPPQLEAQGLGPQVELQLLRIIQEGLSNIRKHARAKNARIVFTVLGLLAQIAVIDDGHGFDSVAARQTEGFGLQAMRERAESLGGCLDIFSQPGLGTQVVVRVPIQIQEEHERGMAVR